MQTQGTLGNDNQVTGFGDQSDNTNNNTSTANSGGQGAAGTLGAQGLKGDPGAQGLEGDPGGQGLKGRSQELKDLKEIQELKDLKEIEELKDLKEYPGLPGPNKILTARVILSDVIDVAPRSAEFIIVRCDSNEQVVGGGLSFGDVSVFDSIPNPPTAPGWGIGVFNDDFLFGTTM